MLEGMPGEEVEIRKEPGRLLVLPAEDPIRTGVRDGSINHDRYLYDARSSTTDKAKTPEEKPPARKSGAE